MPLRLPFHRASRLRWGPAYLLSLVAVCSVAPPLARACASCNCGDPTLTATGVEQPYRNRVRIGLEERVNAREMGMVDARARSTTLRSALLASWSPLSRLTFAATLPWITRWVEHPSGSALVNGLGDLEVVARVVLVRDRKFAARHLLWAVGGIKAPTAPRLRDDRGYFYPEDDQAGSGSWDPQVGLTYAFFGSPLSAFLSASGRITTANPRGWTMGPSIGFTAALQVQPWERWAVQLLAEGRYAWPETLANGKAVPDTGGFLLMLSPAILWSPRTDLLVRLGAGFPAASAFRGSQGEAPQAVLSLTYDLR